MRNTNYRRQGFDPALAQSRFQTFQSQMSLELVCDQIEQFLLEMTPPSGWDIVIQNSLFILNSGSTRMIKLYVQEGSLNSRTVLSFLCPPILSTDILLITETHPHDQEANRIIAKIEEYVTELCNVFSDREIQAILNSMPLLMEFAPNNPDPALSQFALIWRDHFLEENVALLQAFERAGIEPQWIFALSKGDRTIKWDRIGAYFRSRGYNTDIFDNAVFENEQVEKREVARMRIRLEKFIAKAHASGKRIMVIDDGAFLWKCFHDKQRIIDCALEVTVPGLKRLQELHSIDIPVYNLARTELKTIIGYPEIAESCVMRIRQLLAVEKFIGRPVIIIGYGTAGRHIARIFREMGCVVSVVDKEVIRLIEAAERGFRTFKSVSEAIHLVHPFLVVGCTGEISLTVQDFYSLPNNAYVTGIATKDLTELKKCKPEYQITSISNLGYEYKNRQGKRFIQLGNGRSINLFESEGIPNRAYDVFKTSIFLAAKDLCTRYKSLKGMIYLKEVNKAIARSGLLERYYELYLRDRSTEKQG